MTLPLYRNDPVYKALESLLTEKAGIKVIYTEVPDDSIDAQIWARCDSDSDEIIMPIESDSFPDSKKAAEILGHEAAHLLTYLDSTDFEPQRSINESICDFVGICLYSLAEKIAIHEAEQKYSGVL